MRRSGADASGSVWNSFGREVPLRHRHRAREPAADEEALLERLPHVPHLAQALAEVAVPHLGVVAVERADAARILAALERAERGLGRKASRLDRVVHALQPCEVDEAGALTGEQQPGCAEARRHRVPAAARDRLRAPRDPLAALEHLAHERMGLELLQEVVRGQLDVAVVEPDHEAERDHVLAHRIEPGAAELAVLGRLAQRPAERVDDLAERLRDAPDLLHAELPDLRLAAVEPEVVERGARQVPGGSLGEDGHLGDDVGARLEVAERLVLLAAPLVAAADADDAAVLDEQPVGRRLGQHERAARLGLLGRGSGTSARSRRSSCRGCAASAAAGSGAPACG